VSAGGASGCRSPGAGHRVRLGQFRSTGLHGGRRFGYCVAEESSVVARAGAGFLAVVVRIERVPISEAASVGTGLALFVLWRERNFSISLVRRVSFCSGFPICLALAAHDQGSNRPDREAKNGGDHVSDHSEEPPSYLMWCRFEGRHLVALLDKRWYSSRKSFISSGF